MQFRVGVVILTTFLITAILVVSFVGTTPLFKGKYTIYIKFSEAPGVTSDTPIRKAGIRIGQVRNVQFGDNDEGVIVTAEIDKDRHVYKDEECRAMTSLLLGDSSLEFVHLRGTPHDRTPIKNGAIIQGEIGPELTSSIAGLQDKVAKTLDTMDKAGQDMRSVLGRVDRLLGTNEDKINHLIDETGETMKLLQSALAASNDLLGDPKVPRPDQADDRRHAGNPQGDEDHGGEDERHVRLAGAEHAKRRGPDEAARRPRRGARRRRRREHAQAQSVDR